MLKHKLYLYDKDKSGSDYKGKDFSQYIMQGSSSIENLDDTLDSSELTLVGLDFREEFAPTTKFIWELWSITEEEERLFKRLDVVVDNDSVTQPIISDEKYFNHHISFIEAAVIAQKRIVDNIALSYRLKDVSLDKEPTYNTGTSLTVNKKDIDRDNAFAFGYKIKRKLFSITKETTVGHNFVWEFSKNYKVTIGGKKIYPQDFDWESLKYYQITKDGVTPRVEFPIPMLNVYGGVDKETSYEPIGYCDLTVSVIRTNRITQEEETIFSRDIEMYKGLDYTGGGTQWGAKAYSGPILIDLNPGWIQSRTGHELALGQDEQPVSSRTETVHRPYLSKIGTYKTSRSYTPVLNDRKIDFDVEKGFNYEVLIGRKTIEERKVNIEGAHDTQYKIMGYDEIPFYISRLETLQGTFTKLDVSGFHYQVTSNLINYNFGFIGIDDGEKEQILFKPALPLTAFDMFNKVQIATQNLTKQEHSLNKPVLECDKQFYVNENNKGLLQDTKIIEAAYTQNNLWELFMEVGKYIHGRPVIKYGRNNDFEVDFKKYGQTKMSESVAQRISIFNSRFVAEYVSSISSYVNNMVQIGSKITEQVAPKTSSDDYLIYNDVVEIHTSKPILEILKVSVFSETGSIKKDITNYVYAEDIYKLLPIGYEDFEKEYVLKLPEEGVENTYYIKDGKYYVYQNNEFVEYQFANVNKGTALYYSLGDNKIQGLDFRQPTVNPGDAGGEYAIKQILGEVYGLNTSDVRALKVNTYRFEITYRTKNSLRSVQTRPDLRKYLMDAEIDKYPMQQQFNNQEEIYVNAEKFGNNVFGKLIRTGNTVFQMLEWINDEQDLKEVGELYEVDGNRYYITKVKNTYHSEHIISELELSKDFNRLAQIIGIPSEPRFYEIAQTNLIERDKNFNDYIVVGTQKYGNGSTYIGGKYGWRFINDIIFRGTLQEYPQYAVTTFKNDIDSKDLTYLGRESFFKQVMNITSTYYTKNTMSIEWKMDDNLSAGDKVMLADYQPKNIKTDEAYRVLTPVQYCDANGRADLVDFALLSYRNLNEKDIRLLPEVASGTNLEQGPRGPVVASQKSEEDFKSNKKGIILNKDMREIIQLTYNLQMLTDSDRFVISSYLWELKGFKDGKVVLLSEEINKMASDTFDNNLVLFKGDWTTNLYPSPAPVTTSETGISVDINNFFKSETLEGIDLDSVKSVVLYHDNILPGYPKTKFTLARNVDGLTNEEKLASWFVTSPERSFFKEQ